MPELETLIIAQSQSQGEQVFRMIERDRPDLLDQDIAWCGCLAALTVLMGARPKRIVIVDYLRWRLGGYKGGLSPLWYSIKRAKAQGTEVIWW